MAVLLELLTVRRLGVAALLAVALVSVSPGPARADVVITAQSVTVPAGSTNDALDLTLTNTGPGSVQIGGVAVGLFVPTGKGITFTAATTGTTAAPYIFDGLSLFGPNIGTVGGGGLSIVASDLFAVIGSGATIGPGSSAGLAHVLFNVAPGTAPGPVTVSLTPFPTTNLSDFAGNNVPINTLNNGTISITVGSVPEPSTPVLALVGMSLVGCRLSWKRWAARRVAA